MQIEVVYSNSMKINRGNYEQLSPFYSGKTVVSLPDGVSDPEHAESVYRANYAQIQGIIDPLLEADYNKCRTDLANVRIREKDGKKYPSVTSILNPDGMSKKIKNLEQYSARGNAADQVFKELMTTGLEPAVDVSKFPDLKWEYDIKGFIKSNKILKKLELPLWKKDVEVFNDEWMYSGEIDLMKEDVLILDVKTGAWKWEQQIAYAKCIPSVQLVAIADLKENKYIELPINAPECEKAFLKFIHKRGEFLARFGI
jgi:hypothetical protein